MLILNDGVSNGKQDVSIGFHRFFLQIDVDSEVSPPIRKRAIKQFEIRGTKIFFLRPDRVEFPDEIEQRIGVVFCFDDRQLAFVGRQEGLIGIGETGVFALISPHRGSRAGPLITAFEGNEGMVRLES